MTAAFRLDRQPSTIWRTLKRLDAAGAISYTPGRRGAPARVVIL